MADKHDETARELLKALEWYAPDTALRQTSALPSPAHFSRDARTVAARLRKAEADGLREAAGVLESAQELGSVALTASERYMLRVAAGRLRKRAAEKETNG